MSALFEVSDKYELLALHRALFEAKQHPDPEDRDVVGSPFVANLSLRVVDALAELDEPPTFGPSWRDWQRAEKHEHRLPLVRSRIEECAPWSKWDADQKQEYVRTLLAPLVAESSTLSDLVAHGDQHHRAV